MACSIKGGRKGKKDPKKSKTCCIPAVSSGCGATSWCTATSHSAGRAETCSTWSWSWSWRFFSCRHCHCCHRWGNPSAGEPPRSRPWDRRSQWACSPMDCWGWSWAIRSTTQQWIPAMGRWPWRWAKTEGRIESLSNCSKGAHLQVSFVNQNKKKSEERLHTSTKPTGGGQR